MWPRGGPCVLPGDDLGVNACAGRSHVSTVPAPPTQDPAAQGPAPALRARRAPSRKDSMSLTRTLAAVATLAVAAGGVGTAVAAKPKPAPAKATIKAFDKTTYKINRGVVSTL